MTGSQGLQLQRLTQWVHAKTAGNAACVELLLQHLMRTELIVGDRAEGLQWNMQTIAQANVPGTAAALLDACLATLPKRTVATLALAACLRQAFTPLLIATLTDQHVRHTKQQLNACIECGLLTSTIEEEDSPLTLANELVRAAALARLNGTPEADSSLAVPKQITVD